MNTTTPATTTPTSGAFLNLDIRGTTYALYRHATADGAREVVLEKRDGTCYAVTEGMRGERTRCTCPDWTTRHEPLDHTEGCKHCRALVELGEMTNPRPVPPTAQGGLTHTTVEPDQAIADEASDWELLDSIVASIGAAFGSGALAQARERMSDRHGVDRPAPQKETRAAQSSHPSVPHAVDLSPVYSRPARRGRPVKYASVDWSSVAERNARGESRRDLAAELGIPQSVVREKIRRAAALVT